MDTFMALADPTRRRIFELVAATPIDAGTIAGHFAVSRPAISRHLRVLREAGMVRVHRKAQRRVYEVDPSGLDEISAWVERYTLFWSDRLDRLERTAKERR